MYGVSLTPHIGTCMSAQFLLELAAPVSRFTVEERGTTV
jgi:hypothetical protein